MTEHQTAPTLLDGAAYALEMRSALPDTTADDLARAVVVAYLNLNGRYAEAEEISCVRTSAKE